MDPEKKVAFGFEEPTVTRREILGAGAALLTPGLFAAAAERQALPNMLWLVSEDNNPLLGAYGNKLVRTPNIDGLAQGALLYRHVYATAPVCALSRFSILTGVYPESCGPAHHMRATAKVAGLLKTYPQYLREAGYYCTNNAKTDYNCDVDPHAIWNESGCAAHWRNRPNGAPFMAVFNYSTTHESSIFRPQGGKVTPAEVTVPSYLPDTAAVRRDIATYYNRIEMMDGEIGARLAELEDDGLAANTIIFYYSDHGGALPRSKRFCYEEGLRACLIVAVPPAYAHLAPAPMGSEIDVPKSLIDLAPTVLALAGIAKPAQMAGTPLLGARVPASSPYVFGARDRMDERYDMVRTVTDGRYRYIRNYTPHRPWGQHYSFAWQATGYQEWERLKLRGALNHTQARFFGPKPYEELYDLVTDPDEVTNLVERPSTKAHLNALRAALDDHILATNDNGFIPEGAPLEGYLNSRVPEAYPLKQIMHIAAAAARGDAKDLSRFRSGLSERNEVIRYWCAQGLLILGEEATAACPVLLRMLQKDPSPHVRVVAAEALAGLNESAAAVRVLVEMLEHTSYPVRLQAINALTFIDPAASKAALPAIERVAAKSDEEDWTVQSAARYLLNVLQGRYDPSESYFDADWFNKRPAKRLAIQS